jgi:hypothetical protein
MDVAQLKLYKEQLETGLNEDIQAFEKLTGLKVSDCFIWRGQETEAAEIRLTVKLP